MRRLVVILLLFYSSLINSQNLSIKGRVIDRTTKEPVANGVVKLCLEDYTVAETVKGKYYSDLNGMVGRDTLLIEPKIKVIDSAVSNKNGDFFFSLLHNGSYEVYCKIKIDTMGYQYDDIKHILINNNSAFIELKPEVYCEYRQYRNLDTCPVCLRKDNLGKVIYGLPVYDINTPAKIQSKEGEYWIGYCEFDKLCHARWYCYQCKKLF